MRIQPAKQEMQSRRVRHPCQYQRWYKGFTWNKNPRNLLDNISQKVQYHNLSSQVPLLRVEKGARAGKRYYFFLALEGLLNEVKVPPELAHLPFFQSPILGNPTFSLDEIKSMVGGEHDVYDYTNKIPYMPQEIFRDRDPFDSSLSSPPSICKEQDIETKTLQHQHLLYWLSALGSGTWESFKKACDALTIDEPKRVLRRLKLLGHVETSQNGSRWSTTPTTLVESDTRQDSPVFFLCGQRNADLVNELRRYGSLSSTNQSNSDAPTCIRLKLFDSNGISHLIEQVSSRFQIVDAGRAAIRFSEILPDVTIWRQGLRSLTGVLPHSYEVKRFDGSNFVDCSFQEETGLYELWAEESDPRPRYSLFYDQESDYWLQGDWYGLRFLALHKLNIPLIARYRSATAQLAIPFSQRWVEVYERPLVLASGRLPSYNNGWLIYELVSPQLAHQLASKLQVCVEEESACA